MPTTFWSCPNCKLALKNIPGAAAGVMTCGRCAGRALGLDLLKDVSKPELIAELWHMAKAQNRLVGKPCPACRKKTLQVVSSPALGSVVLDLCAACHLVWFDAGEIDRVVKSTVQPTAPDNDADRYADAALEYRGFRRDEGIWFLLDVLRIFRG